ncbi:hypothetical protein M409DRAFT_27799 [Zasmidium cellare ATCC 36951]|uniref:DNA recombination and repair protein Rad51-like C-terminal domain-containing protein n=1 Tax=Zasmidium cellare ATCC 36951 TaxID=1080233 RepID=A0A6A6C769_ZASCE|nr:uncharacterized protein M409DRAFT_27799 [Zasmidium cellare ATCC 36951]KAF2161742.1 hypothetical protein M409DRAFT_27799 [Zasmidium cellare ATCC 36951]
MAAAAPPMLAADMYTPKADDDTWPTELDDLQEPPAKRQKLNTGVKAIDQALDGGFDFGSIHCITAEPDQEIKEVLQTLLLSHLCGSTHATTTVIDSSLSFDLLGLYHALESSSKESQNMNQDAKVMLERLKIMKVFDCIGLAEAVGELRENLEHPPEDVQAKPVPKSTIEDSEDEDEMLDDPLPKRQPPMPAPDETKKEPPRHLLIIDNISKVISPLIKSNYTNGQAGLASLMRSLRHIAREHELCTVMFSTASNKPATEDDTASLFASCTIRPALGPTFGQLLDVHLYLHQIPSRKVAEADNPGSTVEMVNILEVVQDSIGVRYGRWAPFLCKADGTLTDFP